ASDAAKRKEEQKKYGIYFDDDYDYLQHLHDVSCTTVDWEPVEQLSSRTTNLKLPSSVFASKVEEDIGLLNRAAPHSGPHLDLDPDIVAAMDEDFDFEDPGNELEDNFIELANAEGSGSEMGSGDDDDDDDDDECMSNGNKSEDDELGSLCGPQYTFADEETKFSMSSSVIRRNEHLILLDDRFEQMFTNCYGDTDIGALECEEIEGHIAPDSEVMIQYAEKMKAECRLKQPLLEPKSDSQGKCNGWLQNDSLMPLEMQDSKQHWDCESIVSTYSNLL
ncbi:protein LTV1 homolog, partial [Cryptotermes secundus]|uniref:protein LTV1 homolog n=1 Tax=Cryptotermes secundus TaxID=105785 RepID=UPI000CD7DC02